MENDVVIPFSRDFYVFVCVVGMLRTVREAECWKRTAPPVSSSVTGISSRQVGVTEHFSTMSSCPAIVVRCPEIPLNLAATSAVHEELYVY